MFNEWPVKIQHFFVPAILVIVGGVCMEFDGTWLTVGYVLWSIAALSVVWLFLFLSKEAEIQKIREQQYLYAEIIKLDGAKTTTKVVIDKTAIEENALSQAIRELQIAPTKLKLFATQVLNGYKKLTIREWTPIKEGKLFSDGEWRRLIAFMKQPVPGDDRIRFVQSRSDTDERQSFDLTPAGRSWLLGMVDERVINLSVT